MAASSQEGALTALASVADCAKAAFVRYYDSVMPLLRTALTSKAEDKQQVLLSAVHVSALSPLLCIGVQASLLLLQVCTWVTLMPVSMTSKHSCMWRRAQALLRAKALECISLVGMAVGRDRFRADAHEVMKFMQALQQQELDPDDPTGGYMLQVLAAMPSMCHD